MSAAPALSPRARVVFLLIAALYAAVAVAVGVHKGGDFRTHVALAGRLLDGLPLYPGPPPQGVWWPPFGVLVLTTFAALARESLALAKGAFALLLAGCVVWSVWRLRTPGWRAAALAVLAVAVPLQGNFEHLNVAPILLALIVAAIGALEHQDETGAGAWIGLAAALKAFPAVLLLYCAVQGRRRAVAVGVAVAALATVVPVLPGGVEALAVWAGVALHADASGAFSAAGNQSLPALVARLGGGDPAGLLFSAGLLLLAMAALRRRSARVVRDLGLGLAIAVVISPIAWWHYYLLLLPLWVAVLDDRRPEPWHKGALVLAGVLTSGLLTLGAYGWRRTLLQGSIYTWGALVLVAVALVRRHVAPRAPAPAAAVGPRS